MFIFIILLTYLIGDLLAFFLIGYYNFNTVCRKEKFDNVIFLFSWMAILVIICYILSDTDIFNAERFVKTIIEKRRQKKGNPEKVKFINKKDVENLLKQLYDRMNDRELSDVGFQNFIDTFLYHKK